MFAIERIKIIKDYLNKDKHVSVAKLSSLLNVTEVTIRRDLEKLESEGFLKRAHGGAVLIADSDDPPAIEEADDDHALEMLEISDTIFHLVSDNDIIMLTGNSNGYDADPPEPPHANPRLCADLGGPAHPESDANVEG